MAHWLSAQCTRNLCDTKNTISNDLSALSSCIHETRVISSLTIAIHTASNFINWNFKWFNSNSNNNDIQCAIVNGCVNTHFRVHSLFPFEKHKKTEDSVPLWQHMLVFPLSDFFIFSVIVVVECVTVAQSADSRLWVVQFIIFFPLLLLLLCFVSVISHIFQFKTPNVIKWNAVDVEICLWS